jgi:hypothetical protein
MSDYPVRFDVTPPARFERAQVLIRLLVLFVLAVLGGSLGWLYLLLYLALPVAAAAWLSGRTPEDYLARGRPTVVRVLGWIVALFAYLGFLTDEFPGAGGARGVRFEVEPRGRPSVGSALGRLFTSLPGFLLGAIVGFVGAVASVVAAVFVLVDRRVPASIHDFMRGVVRWQARLFAYHASLVDAVPPLEFDGTASQPQSPNEAT